jgi:sucrose-6-phosphate hydrolase SacC (GH32 family)
MALPRVLSLDKNDVLNMEPVEELKALRAEHVQKKNLSVKNSELRIDDIKGNCNSRNDLKMFHLYPFS